MPLLFILPDNSPFAFSLRVFSAENNSVQLLILERENTFSAYTSHAICLILKPPHPLGVLCSKLRMQVKRKVKSFLKGENSTITKFGVNKNEIDEEKIIVLKIK